MTVFNEERVTILEAGRSDYQYWRELWEYRELFAILAWRDIAVRYKQTVIGAAWAVVRPFLTMVIFTIVFGKLARLPTEGDAPYPLMVFAGMLPWFLISTILSDAAGSLVANSNLISKVYFPRLIVPTASAVVALAEFAISLCLMALMMLWFRFLPSWHLILMPVFVVLAVLASIGPALWMTAMNVKYRDFKHIIPFALQFGVYVSPVGFSSEAVPDKWRILYSLNPAVGVIDGFRWCVLGNHVPIYMPGFFASLGVIAILLWTGVRQFRRTERTFADLL